MDLPSLTNLIALALHVMPYQSEGSFVQGSITAVKFHPELFVHESPAVPPYRNFKAH